LMGRRTHLWGLRLVAGGCQGTPMVM
jgi:hypothetical protein